MKNLSALEAVLDYDKPSRRFLDELNENQMKDLSGEIFAKLYWSKRNPQWYEKDTNRLFARLRWALLQIVGGDKLIIPFC